MKLTPNLLFATLSLVLTAASHAAPKQPNIVLVFADDISARELPVYGSSVWSPPNGGDSSDPAFRAQTPVLDQLAEQGAWITTAWGATVCSPSRAMIMTGRYAHQHKWWTNGDCGEILRPDGKREKWPLYESSPLHFGHLAQQAGYGTFWAGKTQMTGDLRNYGFEEGCFTPGNLSDTDNPYTDFKLETVKENGSKRLINADTGLDVDTYAQHGWYWYPHVRLMNHPSSEKDFDWWPNTPEAQKNFGPHTYGPDVELDFAFEFMERQHEQGKPFLVYHCSHLGHDGFNWLDTEETSYWPGTPKIEWDGEKYLRTEPKVTGDKGDYDTHGTVTEAGIHRHINYLDYQMWRYRQKLEEMGIADNTIVIFCADNGTGKYGKHSPDRQKGTHIPLIVYAPGMKKHGKQDVLVNLSDFLPTFADIMGAKIPDDYAIDGESFWPLLMSDQKDHRKWVYGYKGPQQLIRGSKVMKDGLDKWWDVETLPDDLISFPQIEDWKALSQEHRNERNRFREILPTYDLYDTEYDAPGTPPLPKEKQKKSANGKKEEAEADDSSQAGAERTLLFEDDFEGRNELGDRYGEAMTHGEAFTLVDGVLVGKQTRDDHGSVLRVDMDFDDIDIEFNFRFNGGTRFNFVIDDKKEKSVHAGHICRVSISPKSLTVGDDKTGAMNLKVREQRQSDSLSAEEQTALDALLAKTQSSAKIDLKQGEWHRLRVRIKGDLMEAYLDGELATSLTSPGIDHPTKTKFGMTVNGSTIDFDNLKVFAEAVEGGN